MGRYSGSTGLSKCNDCEEGYFAPTHSAAACLKCAAEVEVRWEGMGGNWTIPADPLKLAASLETTPTSLRRTLLTAPPPSSPHRATHRARSPLILAVQYYSYGPNYTSSKGASYCDRCLSTHYMTKDHKCKAKGAGFESIAGDFTTFATLNVKKGRF